jgi:hypothetical protein
MPAIKDRPTSLALVAMLAQTAHKTPIDLDSTAKSLYSRLSPPDILDVNETMLKRFNPFMRSWKSYTKTKENVQRI